MRGADVACVSRERWDTTADDDNLHGSPELVIEVLSPSNTKEEMREKAALYLSTGSEEFWVVDAKRRTDPAQADYQSAAGYQPAPRQV